MKLTKDDAYLFAKGEWFQSWKKMGAHPTTKNKKRGYIFRLWCPDVVSVAVIGDFNDWDPQANPLTKTEHSNIWEGFVPGATAGQAYKYCIRTKQGDLLYKADPYAFWTEKVPGTASRLATDDTFTWHDGLWMGRRQNVDHMHRPLNIYEVHLGSWKRHLDGFDGIGEGEGAGSYLTYEELSHELVDYVKDMGYTHIELMPVMEHPFDGSWGYQVTGYYAPTSRYGKPEEFKAFIDACHKAGIGVILDWVPGGFCKDAHGLARFNGGQLYERDEHPQWGTLQFNFDLGEVKSFLISNVLFWLEEYHVDGIRCDGVTSMLYLNFGIDDPSQKQFNENGTEEDYSAIDFIRQMNTVVGSHYPDVMLMAEESTAWPLVTRPPEVGGLGFHYKWDMGWMNDTLNYCRTDFPWRPGNHNLLTFSIMYAFSENYILALSHDEVVHGKASLIQRMPGDWWRQFAGMRALALYQMTHTGAKLNFMGNEIAQFIEWRFYEGLQWFLLNDFETHRSYQYYIKSLNDVFKKQKGLWQKNYEPEGFEWIDADDAAQSIITFVRHGDRPVDDCVVVINFDPAAHENFRIGVPREGNYKEIFNSDAVEFGGSGVTNVGTIVSHPEPWNGRDNSIVLRIPPLGGMILRRTGSSSFRPAKQKPGPKPGSKHKKTATKSAAKFETSIPKKKTAVSKSKELPAEDASAVKRKTAAGKKVVAAKSKKTTPSKKQTSATVKKKAKNQTPAKKKTARAKQ